MIRVAIIVAMAAGCAPLATETRAPLDGCEWTRPIVMPEIVDTLTREISADHPEVRRFRQDLAAHNKDTVENCRAK